MNATDDPVTPYPYEVQKQLLKDALALMKQAGRILVDVGEHETAYLDDSYYLDTLISAIQDLRSSGRSIDHLAKDGHLTPEQAAEMRAYSAVEPMTPGEAMVAADRAMAQRRLQS